MAGPTLTDRGSRFAEAVTRAFTIIRDSAKDGPAGRSLWVFAKNTFANNWLAPRLGDFEEQNPTIELRLRSDYVEEATPDPGDGQCDIAICRHDNGNNTRLIAEKLFDIDFTPMCSPTLLQQCGGTISLAKLVTMRWVAPQDPWWDIWLVDAGSRRPPGQTPKRLRFNTQTECIASARAGQGVGILTPLFARRELDDGTLVMPFGQRSVDGEAYWLLYEKERRSDRRIMAFRRWLLNSLGK